MCKSIYAFVGALAICGVPRLATAQDTQNPEYCPPGTQPPPAEACPPGQVPPVTQMEEAPPPPPAKHHAAYSPANMSLTFGGGVQDFVRDRISDRTDVAGLWDVRYLLGTRRFLGFEANYTGSAQGVNGTVDNNNGSVVTNQVAGNLRINGTRRRFQPFLTAGVGWAGFHRSGSGQFDTVTIDNRTSSFVAPFGGGLSGYIGTHLVLEARGNYNIITNKDFATGGARPDTWSAQFRAGYAF